MFSIIMSLALAGETPAATPEKKSAATDDNKIVCRSEVTVGSRIPKRICRTKKQWSQIKNENKEQLENRSSYSRGTQNRN